MNDNISYQEIDSTYLERIKEIYQSEGWCAYLNDDEKMKRAFDNSLYILGAFSGEKLIGLVRCVGDGEHVVLIQDLIIEAPYQCRGIGRELMNRIFDKYKDVRFIQVNTDLEDVRNNAFYKAMGMHTLEEKHMISYCR